jgi:uncharacterized membrane protein
MLPTAVEFYNVVVFFHILAVVLAFGPTYAYPVFLAVAERTDPRAIPTVGRGIATWEKIGSAMLVVILIAGIYLVSDGPWSYGDFFVIWGFAFLIFIGAVSGGFFAPKTRRLIEICERDIAASGDGEVKLSDEFQALSGQIARVGQVAGVLAILTIYVMTAKPFL